MLLQNATLNQYNLRQFTIASLIIVAFAVVVFTIIRPPGRLELTYDSDDYLEGGLNYLTGKNPDGVSYTVHAPFLYLYAAMFDNKELACWWLNVFSFGTSLILIFIICRKLGFGHVLCLAGVTLTAFSYPWLQNHFFVWSEPVFSVFVLALVLALVDDRSAGVAIVICVMAFLIRKAGVFLVAGSAITYLTQRKFRELFVLSTVMTAVVITLETISWYKAGSLATAHTALFLQALDRSYHIDVLTSWLLPRYLSWPWRTVIILGIAAGLVIIFRPTVVQWSENKKYRPIQILLISYLTIVFILLGVPEYIEAERYLSVMLPVFNIMMLSFVNEVVAERGWKSALLLIGVIAWSLYPLTRTIFHVL
jgi:hypothetical protein